MKFYKMCFLGLVVVLSVQSTTHAQVLKKLVDKQAAETASKLTGVQAGLVQQAGFYNDALNTAKSIEKVWNDPAKANKGATYGAEGKAIIINGLLNVLTISIDGSAQKSVNEAEKAIASAIEHKKTGDNIKLSLPERADAYATALYYIRKASGSITPLMRQHEGMTLSNKAMIDVLKTAGHW